MEILFMRPVELYYPQARVQLTKTALRIPSVTNSAVESVARALAKGNTASGT